MRTPRGHVESQFLREQYTPLVNGTFRFEQVPVNHEGVLLPALTGLVVPESTAIANVLLRSRYAAVMSP